MASILPSINCHHGDTDAVRAAIARVEGIFDKAGTPAEDRWAHFDVADGAFTYHKSWNEPAKLKSINPHFSFEAHLMVENPATHLKDWLAAGAGRVIIHLESASPEDFAKLASEARASGAEIVLGMNPETPAAAAEPYFKHCSRFLVLAVHPGLSGQKFLWPAVEKISILRRGMPSAKIEVDGGINPETARAALDAGADSLVSGSDIFGNDDPESEYEKLRSL